MTQASPLSLSQAISLVRPETPVLIAGPTASGKSALALEIAKIQGGAIINADASQVYDCWRVLTARPSPEEEMKAPHFLYGHVAADQTYSTGQWLRDVVPILKKDIRPIIVGGTGLYFTALTQGLAEIPATPAETRAQADKLSLEEMLADLDPRTRNSIDHANRARVQRAWEVLATTGRGLCDWQSETPPATLPVEQTQAFVFNMDKEWLNQRIAQRFDMMIEAGAIEEVRANAPFYEPGLPAHRAIGASELMAYIRGEKTLNEAREAAVTATRQFAKRQRTWFRSKMKHWMQVDPTHSP